MHEKEIYGHHYSWRSSNLTLSPKKQYQTLYLQAAAIGKDIDKIIFRNADDYVEIKQTKISVADGLTTIKVDIGGIDELYVEFEVKDGGSLFVPLTTSYYK